MGKRKRPQDAEVVQFTQQTASSTKRGTTTTTVQEKAGNGGILYVQQQQQQNEAVVQHQQPQQQTTTTYYQIQQQPVQHVVKQAITVQQPVADSLTFKCIKCEQIFETKSSFLDHCNQFHYFACDLCANCLFDDLVQLNVHMVKHINKYDMCEKCNMVCSSAEELKAHLGNHITTYNREDLVFTSEGQAVLTTGNQQQAATSNGNVPLSVLNDDSLIEHLASELDQSIGSTMKGKPQKYRCGVCKQDFSDPRLVFKHMNQVHINFPMQQQIQAPPSPPPAPIQQPPPLVPTQQTLTENVVYTNLSTDNIYYDERTGQYYTIQLMDHSPPLAETPGSQSVIEYVHDSGLGEGTTVEYVTTEDAIGETIIVKEEAQKVVITSDDGGGGHHASSHQKPEPPPPLVQITRETDLEELIPTTTLVAGDESSPALPHHHHHHHQHQAITTTTITTTTMTAKQKQAADLKAAQLVAQQQLTVKCVICSNNFVKKFPKQMYCHTCIAKRTA